MTSPKMSTRNKPTGCESHMNVTRSFIAGLIVAVSDVNVTSLKANLASDQLSTTEFADTAAFAGYDDAVERLLPYHVWQIHDEDQDCRPKGKRRREQGEASL